MLWAGWYQEFDVGDLSRTAGAGGYPHGLMAVLEGPYPPGPTEACPQAAAIVVLGGRCSRC